MLSQRLWVSLWALRHSVLLGGGRKTPRFPLSEVYRVPEHLQVGLEAIRFIISTNMTA